MKPCEQHQQHLLHLLYGVLEEEERQDLVAHLGACNDCRLALQRSEEQKKILALAARAEFGPTPFKAPKEGQPPRSSPAPRQPKPPRSIGWVRYAVAASFLLAVVGGLLYAYFGWQSHVTAQAVAQEKFTLAQQTLAQFQNQNQREQKRLQDEVRVGQEEINKVVTQWRDATANTQRVIRDKGAEVIITGPRSLQAGAKNEYKISLRRGPGQRGAKPTMVAQVVNLETKEVLFKKEVGNASLINLDLPRNLPVKPGAALALEVTARDGQGAPIQVSEKLLLVASQFITHLTTDRPMYRPGETVRFRSLTLERFNLKPPEEDFQLRFVITGPNNNQIHKAEGQSQVKGPGQAVINGPDGKPLHGLGAGEFTLPSNLVGGEYTLTVSDISNKFPPEKRKFLVQRYQAPRLNKELQFNRSSYGPGEEVEVVGKVAPAEGDLSRVANQQVIARANIDGREIPLALLKTNAEGKVQIRFKLPAVIERGVGTLSVQFTDGGNWETIVRPIPIVVQKLLVDFYPEGGELIAGVPNRVYFQVRTTLGKPADLRGRIVDHKGAILAAVQTLQDDDQPGVNQGMGLFEFTPQVNQLYELKIDQPLGIQGKHVLPPAKVDGVALAIKAGVVTDKIEVTLHSGQRDRQLLVGAYCRGRLLDQASVKALPGQPTNVTLQSMPGISGVYRVTVFEDKTDQGGPLIPAAERLIYRQAVEQLQFDVESDKKVYQPGDKVKLKLRSSNEKKEKAPAVLLVNVVDLSMLKLADEKTARAMPTHFMLTTEVQRPQNLEYADFMLSAHPKASLALDLLLGTQGWRRFAEQEPVKFQQRERQEAQRLLAVSGQAEQMTNNLAQMELDKVDKKFAVAFVEKQKRLAEKEKAEDKARTEAQTQLTLLQNQVEQSRRAITQRQQDRDNFLKEVFRLGLVAFVIGILIIGLGGLIIGIIRLSQGGPHAVAYLVTGLCLLAFLFIGSLIGTFLMMAMPHEARMFREAAGIAPQAAPIAQDAKDAAPFADEMKPADAKALMGVPPPLPPPGAPDLAVPGMAMPEKLAVGIANAPKAEIANGVEGFKKQRGGMVLPPAEGRPLGGELREEALMPEEAPMGAPMAADMALENQMFRRARPGGFLGNDRQLRRQGNFQALVQNRLGRQALLPVMMEPFLVREFAHTHQPSPDEVRRDFTENLYWHPVLVLADGKGEISFDLSDAVTRFQVQVMGHTLDGRLGSSTFELTSKLPFSVDAKIPMEITSSDKITIPVTLANDTDKTRQATIGVEAWGLTVLDQNERTLSLEAGKRQRQLFEFRPAFVEGDAKLKLRGQLQSVGKDQLERTFKVVPEGFPVVGAHSDMLEGSATHTITLPNEWVSGTLKFQVQVFPSTLADLQKGLEGLLREPGGCFEQSSSSNYPNVLILNYLQESEQSKPEVEKRARQLLDRGYKQLTSFECIPPAEANKRRGYEWFGQTAPPHEALTAYGLLQFKDMARVYQIDQAMVERTRKYLLDQRDGQGGFKRNPRALDSFGRAPDQITNAYIIWALTEDGVKDLGKEIDALIKQAKDSKDPYFLALVGLGLVNSNKTDDAVQVLKTLAGLQKDEGYLQGTQTSITGSAGRDLQIETTALAILSWLKANRPGDFNGNVQKAIGWLGKQRGGYGGFGATQSTILALKALIAHAHDNKRPAEAGELRLYINDQPQPAAVKAFAAKSEEPLIVSLPTVNNVQEDLIPPAPGGPPMPLPPANLLRPGKNKIRVELTGKNAFPFTTTWSYQTLTPPSAEQCPVRLKAQLSKPSAEEGETVRLTATVENTSGKGHGMAVAILGLPGGLTLPEDMTQLKDLARLRDNDTKPGVISAWEIRGRELVLYWRDLAPDAKIQVEIDLICRIPGEYRGPASRAYLYYNADVKHWITPLSIRIDPKGEGI